MNTFKCNKKKHVSDYFRIIDSGAKVFLKRKESILNTVLNAVDKRTAQCRA